ncbi:MAG: hypothetical protein ACOYD4_07845 [Solirubrobacterales bacterium]
MKRALLVTGLLLLALAPAAQGRGERAEITIGKVAITAPVAGRSTLLVPVTYPIAYAGRRVPLRALPLVPGFAEGPLLTTRPRLSAGLPRAPLRRHAFTFVHRIALGRSLTRALVDGKGDGALILAGGFLDVDGDGRAELSLGRGDKRPLPPVARQRGICATAPQLQARPGRRVAVRLPACDLPTRWVLLQRPKHGKARIRHGRLLYRSAAGFRGTDSLRLGAFHPSRQAHSSLQDLVPSPVVVRVGTAQDAVVRALGDSVTAGFGYYDDGSPMGLLSLPECKPGSVTLVDACSSNSTTTSNAAKKLEYAPDYGLANNVSWAAQWANENGITNYENLAVSGSEPVNWAPEGSLHETTERIEAEDPDYILMTLGANPLLSNMLFGVDDMGCAIYADLFGRYDECIEEAFAEVKLREELGDVYRDLVKKTEATIFLMQYHLSIPSTALAYTAFQIAEMGRLLNREIASVAAGVGSKQLVVVAPPHFDVGIDIAPVYPSRYSCSLLGYRVDGPSVQTDASQDELLVDHPLSFCEGPLSGPPWVISGDTGIHPSATGYTQMASRVPAPE